MEREEGKKKRGIRKTIRFTEEEVKKLQRLAEAKGLTISELIRLKVLDLPIPNRISPERLAKKNEDFRKLLYEVNKIGVNINQIARYCNKYREVDVYVLEKLLEIERNLKKLLETAYRGLTDDNKPSDR
jgi:transcriptional regulator with XRE-family HTH domain